MRGSKNTGFCWFNPTIFCINTGVTGWNPVAHVMQEGRRTDFSGSLRSWDVFFLICQSAWESGFQRLKNTQLVLFYDFFLMCILVSHERSVAEHESYSPGQLWLSIFAFLSYALQGFCRRLPSPWQQSQSRTMLAQNDTVILEQQPIST